MHNAGCFCREEHNSLRNATKIPSGSKQLQVVRLTRWRGDAMLVLALIFYLRRAICRRCRTILTVCSWKRAYLPSSLLNCGSSSGLLRSDAARSSPVAPVRIAAAAEALRCCQERQANIRLPVERGVQSNTTYPPTIFCVRQAVADPPNPVRGAVVVILHNDFGPRWQSPQPPGGSGPTWRSWMTHGVRPCSGGRALLIRIPAYRRRLLLPYRMFDLTPCDVFASAHSTLRRGRQQYEFRTNDQQPDTQASNWATALDPESRAQCLPNPQRRIPHEPSGSPK